ncbi:MAG: 4Fe-4S single cluster domain-containing protein, partial [Acutalibacteraceae bacterium]
MNYATIKPNDVANGPGVRVSLFVSGCTHRCKNCFNSEAWDFNYGEPFTKEVEDKIISDMNHDYIAGFSLLGGEPFEPQNQKVLCEVLER